jgi:hypothetical protein
VERSTDSSCSTYGSHNFRIVVAVYFALYYHSGM